MEIGTNKILTTQGHRLFPFIRARFEIRNSPIVSLILLKWHSFVLSLSKFGAIFKLRANNICHGLHCEVIESL